MSKKQKQIFSEIKVRPLKLGVTNTQVLYPDPTQEKKVRVTTERFIGSTDSSLSRIYCSDLCDIMNDCIILKVGVRDYIPSTDQWTKLVPLILILMHWKRLLLLKTGSKVLMSV